MNLQVFRERDLCRFQPDYTYKVKMKLIVVTDKRTGEPHISLRIFNAD